MMLNPLILLFFLAEVALAFKEAVPHELTYLAAFCDDRVLSQDDEERGKLLAYVLEDTKIMGDKCLRKLILSQLKIKGNFDLSEVTKNKLAEYELVDRNGNVDYAKFYYAVDQFNRMPYNPQQGRWEDPLLAGNGVLEGRVYLDPLKRGDNNTEQRAKVRESTRLYAQVTYASDALALKVQNSDLLSREDRQNIGNALKSIVTTRGDDLLNTYKEIYSAMTDDSKTVQMKEGSKQTVTRDQVKSFITTITGSDNPTTPKHVDYDRLVNAVINDDVLPLRYKVHGTTMVLSIEEPTNTQLGHMIPIKNVKRGYDVLKKCF